MVFYFLMAVFQGEKNVNSHHKNQCRMGDGFGGGRLSSPKRLRRKQ
jgi:hypothetical protein